MNWRNYIPFTVFFRPEPTPLELVQQEVNKLISKRDYHTAELRKTNTQLAELQTWIGQVK